MIDLIRQRISSDCGICCLAMVSGRSYDDVLTAVGDAFDPGKGLCSEQTALKRLGYAYTFENGEAVGDIVCLHRGYIITPDYFRSMAWRRRALLSVPSLNIHNGWHMVYYDGSRVLDPSNGKTYERFDQLKPEEMTLFSEAAA